MKLITMLDDERLSDEGGYIGFNPEILYVESLRAALRERDQYSREMMNEERSKNTLRSRVKELEGENKRLMKHIDWLTYRAGEAIEQAIGEELMRGGGRAGKEGPAQ